MTVLALIRARLPWLVATWVLLYAGVGVIVARNMIVEACSCSGLAAGQMCPMHHNTASPSRCRLVSGQASSEPAFWSMFAPTGVMPDRTIASHSLRSSHRVDSLSSIPIERPDHPDAPPPRA
jgi:hypothetical protein